MRYLRKTLVKACNGADTECWNCILSGILTTEKDDLVFLLLVAVVVLKYMYTNRLPFSHPSLKWICMPILYSADEGEAASN